MKQFLNRHLAGPALFAALAMGAGATGAEAQPLSAPQNYGVRTMSFELWCQQTQRYTAERCMARRPEDVRAFENYRAVVERYELEYLKQVQKERNTQSFTTRDPNRTIFEKTDGIR